MRGRRERKDRTFASLSLPAGQDDLIRRVAAANPRTVVVLQTGGSVLTPWAQQVGAILEAWYPGNRGAEAIANILFGRVNPSGRLPISFPRAEADLPRPHPAEPQADPMKPDVAPARLPVVKLSEGLAVGYRWYDAQGKTPAYEFGYGLSYTTFAYSNLAVNPDLSVAFRSRQHRRAQGHRSRAAVSGVSAVGRRAFEAAGGLGARGAGTRRAASRADRAGSLCASRLGYERREWRHPAGRYRVHVGASSRKLPLVQEIDIAR